MTEAIEMQVISRILTSDNKEEVEILCQYDESYYSALGNYIRFILDHKEKYGNVPDIFTFITEFEEFNTVTCDESITYLTDGLKAIKKRKMLVEVYNKIRDKSTWDVSEAWEYLESACEVVAEMTETKPMDIVHDVDIRTEQIKSFNSQQRIPTGFDEIDKAMYGGLSTVEELVVMVARMGTGKSWVATKMMTSAQAHGFPVLYYSPEMQASFIGTRFDTWRAHFKNSQLHQGKYTDEYIEYTKKLKADETPAFILEDKDVPDDEVTVPYLKNFVKKNGIKLLIIDGLSYMHDARGKQSDTDSVRYKNLCTDLFRLSKQCGCAVVVIMQANRASIASKDDKGEVFPNIFNIEGSDHPARIATQVFAMRQIFDKHILDIRLEKSRNASNRQPVFSYMWDIDTGEATFTQNAEDAAASTGDSVIPIVNAGLDVPNIDDIADVDIGAEADIQF